MRALLTHGSGPARQLLEIAEPNMAAYAQRHGYTLVTSSDEPGDGSLTEHWAKIRLLRDLLADAELVLWVDCDLILVDHGHDIADELHPDDFQALCMEQTPHGPGPNTGLWIIRGDDRGRAFIDAVSDCGQLPDAQLHDQATVAHLLGFSYLPALTRPLHGSPWLTGTGWLDPSWNTLSVFQDEAHARGAHFGGMPVDEKAMRMRRTLVRERLPGWQRHASPETARNITHRAWPHPTTRNVR